MHNSRIARRLPHVGLVARFCIVGVSVALLVAAGLAWFIQQQLTIVLLDNIVARATEQVDHLALTGYVTGDDFATPHTPEKLASIAARLDPFFNDMHRTGSGVIRLQMFSRDGTLLYADLPSKRGEVIDLDDEDHLDEALQGRTVSEVSDLEEPENSELKAEFGEALEVYVPVEIGDDVVGAYEIYQDMAPVRAVQPLVWGSVLAGFGVLFIAQLAVVQAAAVLIRRQQQTLAHRSLYDSLTDLPNRALFLDRVGHALARRAPAPVAVLFVDLDGLKLVNDSLGHAAGDRLLVAVGERLTACLSHGDTVARLGGDEFNILLEDVNDTCAASVFAENILSALRAPLAVDGRELFPTASIGLALSTSETDTAEALVRDAETAMFRAKARGKDGYAVYSGSMAGNADERLALETDLRRALDRGELRLYYQPVLSLADGHVAEVEALVRWQHPRRGLLAPQAFIPVAEETGLIVPIGQWVLEEACRQAVAWRTRLGDRAPIMGVNLSARQFQRPELLSDIRRALQAARLDPRWLKLEITESVVMADAESTVETLRALKALGIGLAIDDFGTGYSSLAYLKRFPVDTLKVDRSFVDGLGDDPQDTAIVQSVVALARALGLSVTGEGVETETQRLGLANLGAQRAQGFLFAQPRPAVELDQLLFGSSTTLPRAA